MRIGLDLDGVTYDFVGQFRNYLKYVWQHEHDMPEPIEWHFAESWGLTTDEFSERIQQGIDANILFRFGSAYPGAVDTINRLYDYGHSIHFITHRDPRAWAHTTEWLIDAGINYDTLNITADKTAVRTDIFLEDNIDNYLQILQSGTWSVLMDRPWNRLGDCFLNRVHGWDQFSEQVDLISTLGKVGA